MHDIGASIKINKSQLYSLSQTQQLGFQSQFHFPQIPLPFPEAHNVFISLLFCPFFLPRIFSRENETPRKSSIPTLYIATHTYRLKDKIYNYQKYKNPTMAEVDLSKKVADRYLKREVLGEGTYGVVYKAIDTKVKPQLFFAIDLFFNFVISNFQLILIDFHLICEQKQDNNC